MKPLHLVRRLFYGLKAPAPAHSAGVNVFLAVC